MRTVSTLRCALAAAFVLAGACFMPTAQAQRLSPEAAEAEGIELGAPAELAPAAPAEGGLQVCVDDVLLVVDSGNDAVDVHDPATGDLVIDNFILDPTNLSTPKNAIPNFDGDGIFVVDQIDDAVQEYDCNGAYVGLFAPAGGVNTAILDNAIGMDYSPDGTELWVTVTGGANQDAVARFDQSGNYLGNIVANGSGGVDGPFDVLVRASDMLVPAINGGDDVHQYDHAGNFLGIFQDPLSALQFPEQANLAANGNVLVAGFSSPSGAYEYDGTTGAEVGYYNVVSGLRGIYELPNGNLLVTASAGLHEITRSNTLVRVISGGDQYIELFEGPDAGCDLSLNSVTVTPDPVSPGDFLSITVDAANAGDPQTASLMMTYTGPVSGMINFGSATVPTTSSITRTFRLRVPGQAPQGAYTATFELKDAAGDACDADAVVINVMAVRQGQTGDVAFELVDGGLAAADAAAATVGVSPNPFVGRTHIEFALEAPAQVRLAVYDVLGRQVAVLVDGALDAGVHRAAFDAAGLAAGTYVYRLAIGSEVQTGRMTLTR